MAYFKIKTWDVSAYVSGLKVSTAANYHAQTNAAGNTVVDLINLKKTIEVSFIPIRDENIMKVIQSYLDNFTMEITFRNPQTGKDETINVMLPTYEADYYTIQDNKVMYKPFTLTFIEL